MVTDENDLSARFSAIKRHAKKLTKQLEDLIQVKWSDKASLQRLAKITKRLPSGSTYGQAVDEVKRDLEALVNQAQIEQRKRFGASEAQFVKALDPGPRESSNGWRIGSIEMELKREEAVGRTSYNHYPIGTWFPVGSSEDLQKGLAKAVELLESSKIPGEQFALALESAYRYLLVEAKRTQLVNTTTVPIKDFYREVRVALTRSDLIGKPGRRLKTIEFAEWAFVHNLDLFIAAGAKTRDWRMTLQTGSQAEQQRGIGMTTNGLNPGSDYRVFCYVQLEKLSG